MKHKNTYFIIAEAQIIVDKDYGNSEIAKKMIGEYIIEQLHKITGDITVDKITHMHVEPKIVS